MQKHSLGSTKTLLRSNGDRRARVRVPLEILRGCGAKDVAASFRREIRDRGLNDRVSLDRGFLYHTVTLEMEGPAKDIIPILERIERMDQENDEE